MGMFDEVRCRYPLPDKAHTLLAELSPGMRPLDPWFLAIVGAGTGREFVPEDNARWAETTRPILEAFFHAR